MGVQMTDYVIATLDSVTGRVVVDDEQPGASMVRDALSSVFDGTGANVGCARPAEVLRFPDGPPPPLVRRIRVSGYWHDDFMVGPGRRSVLRMQGCPIRCHGCYVPETWDSNGGQTVSINTAATALLAAREHDGVTIIGGEPFAQPFALMQLVRALKMTRTHVVVYTGFTLERLRQRSDEESIGAIEYVLNTIDVLIDGPYIAALADGAGPWTGSGNQRVHYLR